MKTNKRPIGAERFAKFSLDPQYISTFYDWLRDDEVIGLDTFHLRQDLSIALGRRDLTEVYADD